MVDIKYANAYNEVLEILKYIPEEDYNKIPKEKIELFETNANDNYKFNYEPNKTLDEQNVSKIAKGIIAILFRDYWANDNQREKIIAKQNYDRIKQEEQKREKYDPDELFKKKKIDAVKENENKEEINNLPIEVKKERFYEKIINFFKKIFYIG